jgi:hypothetical protein
MTATKTSKKKLQQGKKKKGGSKKRHDGAMAGLQLDGLAVRYAELLKNPCNGPLVSGPFGDGTGGIITRFESDAILDLTATSTCSAIIFCPSTMTYYSTTSAFPLVTDATTWTGIQTGNQASLFGSNLLSVENSEYRVLSACLQTYFPGAEVARAGITGTGQALAGNFQSTTPTTGQMRTMANYVERTPASCSEVVWRPSEFDLQWSMANNTDVITSANFARRSVLFSSTSGLPTATGMRYRMVVVVEWIPGAGVGLPSIIKSPQSTSTLSHVLTYLDRAGDWAYNGALSVGKAGASLYRGYTAVRDVSYGVAKAGRTLALMA